MGYFNMFYKITRLIDMLTRKRNRRFILIILIIIGVIFLLHNKGYCAQSDSEYTTDTSYFIIEEYDNLLNSVVVAYDKSYTQSVGYKGLWDTFFNNILNGTYYYVYSPSLNNPYIFLYPYYKSWNKTLVDTSLVYNDNLRVPSTGYNITLPANTSHYFAINTDNGSIVYDQDGHQSDYNIFVPSIILYKQPTQFISLLERSGFGYNGTSNEIINIKNLLQQQNNKLDAINDSLTDETYDEDAIDFDTSSFDNVSDTEIQGLFTGVVGSFQNSLASYGGTIIKIIPLPHGGQIEIPSNIVSSHLGNLSALVEAFWYFVFGIYLFRFVSNLIHKIKSGDILNGYTNDNEIITSSML